MQNIRHPASRQQGSALVIILIMLGIFATVLVSALKSNPQIARDKITADALAKAKEALIGYAATYRDTHPAPGPMYNQVFGYLPCPASDGNGVAGNCGSKDVTLIGLLPWKTLGLPPLRDSSGECLWYAVSGSHKDNPQTTTMNWDTVGQIVVNDPGGAILASGVAAVIFSPRGVIGSQDRTPVGATECGGGTTVAAYLDGGDPIYAATVPAAGATTTLTVATTASIANATNNDQGLWISPDEIFRRIRQRSDFVTEINAMRTDIATCLNNLALALLPIPNGSKGVGSSLETSCPPLAVGTKKGNIYANWRENLLYARLPAPTVISINGAPSPSPCAAVLIFGGERTASQARVTAANKGDAAMYLEGINATSFPGGTAYSGVSAYAATTSAADVLACITGAGGGGATQVTFANTADFAKFATGVAGVGVTVDSATQTLAIDVAAGSGGGCAWFPDAIPLSGKTLRTYHTFQFTHDDPIGAVDLGNGFTLSFLRGSDGVPTASTCGTQSNMGVIPASDRLYSLFVETDVHRDGGGINDPAGNHTAIMLNGNLSHSGVFACDGTAQGCLHSPANKFEESPTPTEHNQRVEIHTGYSDSSCTATGGTFARVKVWVDCAACSDTAANFPAPPTANRCFDLDATMNTVYFGFTGGFSSSGGGQGVSIRSLDLRVE